jgi:hypothetical protein
VVKTKTAQKVGVLAGVEGKLKVKVATPSSAQRINRQVKKTLRKAEFVSQILMNSIPNGNLSSQGHATPHLPKIPWDVMTERPSAIGQQRIRSALACSQSQQTRRRKKGNPIISPPVEAFDDRDVTRPDFHETMFRNMNPRFTGQCEGEDLAPCDISPVIGLGKLGNRQTAVRQ